jgi:hypothetical protein
LRIAWSEDADKKASEKQKQEDEEKKKRQKPSNSERAHLTRLQKSALL